MMGAVFIDFTKAFDSINITLLFKKLAFILNSDPWLCELIHSHMLGRVFKIKNNSSFSQYFPLHKGTPQGSSLAGLIFAIFIDDVGDSIDLEYLLYADDLVVYCDGTNAKIIQAKLQSTIDKLQDWCIINDLTINIEKTKFIVFHKHHSYPTNLDDISLHIKGTPIERVKKFKYLGLIYDETMSFSSHYDMVFSKICKSICVIKPLKRSLPLNLVINYFKSLVLPHLDYCSDVWAVHNENGLYRIHKKIESFMLSCYYKGRRSMKQRCKLSSLYVSWNLLTMYERTQLSLFKNVIKVHFNQSSIPKFNEWFNLQPSTNSRTLQLLNVPVFSSETFKYSYLYRTIKMWNSLPKDWNILEHTYGQFVSKFIAYLKLKRNDEILYY